MERACARRGREGGGGEEGGEVGSEWEVKNVVAAARSGRWGAAHAGLVTEKKGERRDKGGNG